MTIEKQWKAITVVAITIVIGVFLFFFHGFLSWSARVGHNQSGVGMNALMQAVTQYAEDHKGVMPPMKDRTLFRQALWPYTKSESTFLRSMAGHFSPTHNCLVSQSAGSSSPQLCFTKPQLVLQTILGGLLSFHRTPFTLRLAILILRV